MDEMYVLVNKGTSFWYEGFPIPGEDPQAYFSLKEAVDEANALRVEFLNPEIYVYELRPVDVGLLNPNTQVVCYVCGQPVDKSGEIGRASCRERV